MQGEKSFPSYTTITAYFSEELQLLEIPVGYLTDLWSYESKSQVRAA